MFLISGCYYNPFTRVSIKGSEYRYSGITLTLTENFSVDPNGEYHCTFVSSEISVGICEFKFSEHEILKDITTEDYAKGYSKFHELNNKITDDNGITRLYSEDKPEENSGDKKYFARIGYLYKSEKAFYSVEFIVPLEKADKLSPVVSEWAHSAKFS